MVVGEGGRSTGVLLYKHILTYEIIHAITYEVPIHIRTHVHVSKAQYIVFCILPGEERYEGVNSESEESELFYFVSIRQTVTMVMHYK